jgi:hypothetical protein
VTYINICTHISGEREGENRKYTNS